MVSEKNFDFGRKGENSTLMKDLMRDSAEEKKISEKKNRWTQHLKPPKKFSPEEITDWESKKAALTLMDCYTITMRECGYRPLGHAAGILKAWKNFHKKMNGSLEESTTILEWFIRNWKTLCARKKLKAAEPTVHLLVSVWFDEYISEALKGSTKEESKKSDTFDWGGI